MPDPRSVLRNQGLGPEMRDQRLQSMFGAWPGLAWHAMSCPDAMRRLPSAWAKGEKGGGWDGVDRPPTFNI